MAGYSWNWQALLSRRKDGRYSLKLKHIVEEGQAWRVQGLVGFRKGYSLLEFLPCPWREYTGRSLNEKDWRKIARLIKTRDKHLARDLLEAVDEEFDTTPPDPAPAKPSTPLDVAIAGATWARVGGTGSIGRATQSALHRRGASHFATQYFTRTGSLPTGSHRVQVTYGPAKSGADIVAPAVGMAPGRLDLEVTFPALLDVAPPPLWPLRLLSESDFDGELNFWTWDADLVKRTDGSYRATVTQCPGAPGDEDWVAAEKDGLSDGLELFQFLHRAWAEWATKKLTMDEWREVAKLLRQADADLGYDFEAAIEEEFNPQEFVGPPEPPTALERCIGDAQWDSPSFGGGGAIWAAIAFKLRMGSAVRVYATRHLASNGALPQGPHRVQLTYGPEGADFTCPGARSNRGTVDQEVVFAAADHASPESHLVSPVQPRR